MDKEIFYRKTLPTICFVILLILSMYLCIPKKMDTVKIEVAPPLDKTEYDTINVLIDGSIKEMGFEEYLVHVVAGEMYSDYHMEALKAQAVTARTYTYKKLINGGCGNGGAEICDDFRHCQAFSDNIPEDVLERMEYAVYSTKGEIITYDGEPITALFHSTSGGYTEDNVNVFGANLPYLKSVVSEGEEDSPRYSQTEKVAVSEIKKKAKAQGNTISVTERLPSGRVRSVDVFGKTMTGKQLRELIGLSSANFEVHIEGEYAVFTTIGYGHGVGLSQVGANYMAQQGKSYEEIIKHYYTDVELSKISL